MPNLVFWIIGAPILMYINLYKNKKKLEEEYMTSYFLILYQGYRQEVYYWEFVNTIRKIFIMTFDTILSTSSRFYAILLSFIFIILTIRLQIKLKPYKNDANNNLEVRAIGVNAVTIYCGILFDQSHDNKVSSLVNIAFIILVIANSIFLLEWTYMLLVSINIKNENLIK